MTTWQDVLASIRDGKKTIPVNDDGIPLVGARAALYELLELMAALTSGYNDLVLRDAENRKRIERIRKLAEAHFPADRKAEADGWIPVEDMLPPKSGEYFTYGSNLGVCPLYYSSMHKLWNTHDQTTPEEAAETAFTEITHWFPRPAAPEKKEV